MKTFAFGSLRFQRESIPDEIKDWSVWPMVDELSLDEDERKAYQSRERAIRCFVDNPEMRIADICRETGVSTSTLYRLFERCCKKHPDGRIYGFRGLVRYRRVARYSRTKPIERSGSREKGGAAGAFSMLLDRYPALEEFLVKELKKRSRKIEAAEEVRKSVKKIHRGFLEKCRGLGIGADDYPFNQDYCGFRSLATHLKRLANQSFEMASRNAGASSVGAPMSSKERRAAPAALNPFEVVEFDGHKIDLRLVLTVQDPYGLETRMELGRIWILVLLDILTRAVLGYALAYGKEYTKDDVAVALQASLLPHQPRKLRIPGLAIRAGGGFPSAIIPEAAFACWEWFRFDNAKANLAYDTLERLCEVVGCWTDAGPPGEPNKRPFIEQFFRVIAEHFAHRVVGTTGSRPDDIVRQLGDPGSKAELLMDLDELEDVIEVVLGNYNGEVGASGRSPLEAMTHHIAKRRGFIRSVPREQRGKIRLIQQARIVTIRGSLKDGVRPHVNFEHVRYTSDVLGNNPGLIGKKVKIYFNPFDIRFLTAFFVDGAELGVLTAARPWCYTPHSLRVRQDIHRLKALGKLKIGADDDPVEVWVKKKRAEAARSKSARHQLAKHRQSGTNSPRQSDRQQGHEDGGHDNSPSRSKERNRSRMDDTDQPQAEHSKPQPKSLKIKRTIVF